MRQVTKEEYEVLKKFGVPVEIRYYAGDDKKAKKKRSTRPISGTGKGPNQPVQLTGTRYDYAPGSLYGKLQKTMFKILNHDPTMVMGRTDLRNKIMEEAKVTMAQAAPFVSDSIHKHKTLQIMSKS